MVLLYLVQFVLIPLMLPQYYRGSSESTGIFLLTLTVAEVIGNLSGYIKMADWIPADLIYVVLINCYSPKGAYHILLDQDMSFFHRSVISGIYLAVLLAYEGLWYIILYPARRRKKRRSVKVH